MKSGWIHRFGIPLMVFLTTAAVGFIAGTRKEPLNPVREKSPPLPEHVRQAITPVLAARSDEDRQRAAVHLARSVPVAEMADWLDGRWYPSAAGLDAWVFDRLIRQRWLEQDPAGLASACVFRNTGDFEQIIRIWTKRDPEGVVAWLWRVEGTDGLNRIAQTCFNEVLRNKPLLALAQAPVIHDRLGESASPWLAAMLANIARDHQDAVRQQQSAWPESLRSMAHRALNSVSATSDFPEIIARMKKEPDGLEQFVKAISSDRFAARVLENADLLPKGWLAAASLSEYSFFMMDTDPKYWLDVDLSAHGLSDSMVSKLLDFGMSGLMNRDPEQAVLLLKRGDLRPKDRRELLVNGFSRLAKRDQRRAEDCLAELTDPKEIARARDSINNAFVGTLSKPEAPLKLTAQEWLAAFASERGLPARQAKSALEWNAGTTAILRDGFAALSEPQKDMVSLASVLFDSRNMGESRGDLSALTWLRAEGIARYLNDPPHARINLQIDLSMVEPSIMRFAIGWALEDPVSASRWAQEDLPLGPMRIGVMKNVADYWHKYQPAAAMSWLRSLPDGEREKIERHFRPNP